jgi:hypothetical protein
VILQVAPSNRCLSLQLVKPLVLGRGLALGADELLDLSEYQAYHLGVSRRHCRLQRCDNRLMITDLGSANGTSLNGEPLPANRERLVSHGDLLALGRLNVTVYFSNVEAS